MVEFMILLNAILNTNIDNVPKDTKADIEYNIKQSKIDDEKELKELKDVLNSIKIY